MRRSRLRSVALCMWACAATASAQGTKWHPGNYVALDGGATLSQHMVHIDEIRNDAEIRGVMVRFRWRDLEPTRDVYDFSLIDTYLAKLRRTNTIKRLVVRIMDRGFLVSDPADPVPSYLLADPAFNGGVVDTSSGYAARLWEPAVMQRLIYLYQALGRRYDSDPFFEGAFTEESTLSFKGNYPAGYTNEQLVDQYILFMNAVKPTMPTSNLFMNANWIGSTNLMAKLVDAVRAAGLGAGGSSVLPGHPTQGQQVLIGTDGADYRLELPIADGVEGSELGGALGDYAPTEIGAYAYDVLQAHYLFWARNIWIGGAEQRWQTGILPYLRTNPPTRTRCPNIYGICLEDDPVRRVNSPPNVSAGADSSTQLPPGTLMLQGAVSDDGLPGPLASVQWSQVAGPDTVAFDDATSPTSEVAFPSAGTYTLRLTASDGELSASDDVAITVAAANQPPLVDAGSDVSAAGPSATVELTGSVTDDGQPQPMPTVQWTQVDGPAAATLDTPNAPMTAATFTAAGTYLLRLTASDGALSASDDVTVTIEQPAPYSPPPPSSSPPASAETGGGGSLGLFEVALLGALVLRRTLTRRPPTPKANAG